MNQTYARRIAGLMLTCAAAFAASSAPAHAITPTITGDDGAAVPLTNGMTLRHMAPDVNFSFTAEEQYYSARVVGPAGPASNGTDCLRTSSPFAERVRYQGNGGYIVHFKAANTSEACESAAEQTAGFTINATTSLTPPDRQPLLTRKIGSPSLISFNVPVNTNPGAEAYELRYAANATLAPDGGIAGTSQTASVDASTGVASVSFPRPGRYTLVVRAKTFRSDVATPWSPRLDITVVAPFDLSSLVFPDQRGPSYSLLAVVREPTARGKVKISIGKGTKPKRFRRLGTARIGKGGKLRLRFRYRKFGAHVLKFTYKGNATTDRGWWKEPITISRTRF